MGGKRSAEEPFVQQHGIGDTQVRHGPEAGKPLPGVCLVEPMEAVRWQIRHAGLKKMAGTGDQCVDAGLGHRSLPRKLCFGVHADRAVDGSSGALGYLNRGVTCRVYGPLRGRKSQDAAQDQQRHWSLENSRGYGLGSHDLKARGGSLQGFVARLEPRGITMNSD